jgi:hypothetical protein
MADDLSKWPLLAFMEHVNQWATLAQGARFWRDLVEHRMWAGRLREEAKGIIVWLELRGQDAAAARLDEAMGELRRSVWDCREACEGVYPPEEPRCQDAREAMIAAAGRVAGAAEDLDAELGEEVWEGFFDE